MQPLFVTRRPRQSKSFAGNRGGGVLTHGFLDRAASARKRSVVLEAPKQLRSHLECVEDA